MERHRWGEATTQVEGYAWMQLAATAVGGEEGGGGGGGSGGGEIIIMSKDGV